MRRATLPLLLTCLLALGLAAGARAGGYSPELKFERITMQDGLPDSNVTAILQDHLGFLWLGTLNGLVRYDGYDFVTFKPDPDDPASLSGRSITALYEDRANDLWIGTRRGGLNRLDRASGRFVHYRHDPENPSSLSQDAVGAIHQDRAGNLWVGTGDAEVKALGGGLDRFDRATGIFTHFRHDPGDSTSLSHSVVGAILEDAEERLWVTTPYGGLNLLDRESGTFTHYRHDPEDPDSLAHDSISAIIERSKGGLWMATWGGALHRFDPETGTFERLLEDSAALRWPTSSATPVGLDKAPIWSLFEDSTGILWLGTWQGPLISYDPESGKVSSFVHDPGDPASLSDSEAVISITEDRAGILWFGTWRGGLNKRDRFANKFLHITHQPGERHSLIHRRVNALHVDRAERLWIGTDGGIDRYSAATEEVTSFQHDPQDPASLASDQVSAICEDGSGAVWVGTRGSGLDRLDPETGRFSHYVSDRGDRESLSSNWVTAVLVDREGELWVGTGGHGLNRMDRATGRFERFRHDPEDSRSLGHDWIYTLYDDREGTLWVGAEGMGLQRFDRERRAFVSYFDPLSGLDTVLSIHQDAAGRLWAGTTGGLHLVDRTTGKSQAITERNGLAHDAVYAILEDAGGRLWLATGGGVSCFDPEARRFKNYGIRDGLQSQLGLAAARTPSGDLIFAGSDGLNALHPDHIPDNPHPPQVALTDFKIFDRSVRPGPDAPLAVDISVAEVITLAHRQNVISFEFSGLHFSQPQANRYAYKLAGFSWDWAEVDGRDRSATYTNLSPGSYVFKVRAANADGVWNEQGAQVVVRVRPPWWQTWWAYTGYGLLALGAIVAGDRFQRARVIKGEREAARRQEARLRTEAAELQARAAEAQAKALQAENDRKSQELEEARRLQLSMLPESVPWHPDVEIAAYMRTATEVGGDYYDFDIADDGTLTLAIGDATGHGTGAGTMVTATKSLFHLLARQHDVVEMLRQSTRALKRMGLKRFVGPPTEGRLYMALALARLKDRTLEFANAGMPPVLVYRAGSRIVEEVAVDGMPLGGQIRFPYEKRAIVLEPGDTVVLMSDGFAEMFDPDGGYFGYERITAALEEVARRPPQEVIDHFVAAAEAWTSGAALDDDMTFVVLRVKAPQDPSLTA